MVETLRIAKVWRPGGHVAMHIPNIESFLPSPLFVAFNLCTLLPVGDRDRLLR